MKAKVEYGYRFLKIKTQKIIVGTNSHLEDEAHILEEYKVCVS